MIMIRGTWYPWHQIGRIKENRDGLDAYDVHGEYLGQVLGDDSLLNAESVLPNPIHWRVYGWGYDPESPIDGDQGFWVYEIPVVGWHIGEMGPTPISADVFDSRQDFFLRNTETDECWLLGQCSYKSFEEAKDALLNRVKRERSKKIEKE